MKKDLKQFMNERPELLELDPIEVQHLYDQYMEDSIFDEDFTGEPIWDL